MTCKRRLAAGQWWKFCGETDMGQTVPVQCVECGGRYGFVLAGVPNEAQAVVEADRARNAAMEAWAAAGFAGDLEDYPLKEL